MDIKEQFHNTVERLRAYSFVFYIVSGGAYIDGKKEREENMAHQKDQSTPS